MVCVYKQSALFRLVPFGSSQSRVASAGKAVDCAVISTRGNMSPRPTAQTTTSTSAWPPCTRLPPFVLVPTSGPANSQSASLCVKAHGKWRARQQSAAETPPKASPVPSPRFCARRSPQMTSVEATCGKRGRRSSRLSGGSRTESLRVKGTQIKNQHE